MAMDPVSVLGLVAGALDICHSLVRSMQHARQSVADQRFAHEDKFGRPFEIGLELSAQKLSSWRDLWASQNEDGVEDSLTIEDDKPETWQCLWGYEGYSDVKRRLQDILRATQDIQKLTEHRNAIRRSSTSLSTKPYAFWRKRQSLPPPVDVRHAQEEMVEYVRKLSKRIDELCIYSESAFKSNKPLDALQDLEVAADDAAVNLILQRMRASAELFHSCRGNSLVFGLEMRLTGRPGDPYAEPTMAGLPPANLTYNFLLRNPDSSKSMQDVSLALDTDFDADGGDESITALEEFRRLAGFRQPALIPAPASRSDRRFRIDTPPSNVSLESDPEILQLLFQKLEDSNAELLSTASRLPLSEKIQLAFTIVECGLCLLGTPWLSFLNSNNIYRIHSKPPKINGPERQRQEPRYVLSMQVDGMDDRELHHVPDISEPSHITRIGVLLIEIALGAPVTSLDIEDPVPWAAFQEQLPEVERAMGSQYCKAVAFCLRQRRALSMSDRVEKYEQHDNEIWKSYLARINEEYETQVYDRLKELYIDSLNYEYV